MEFFFGQRAFSEKTHTHWRMLGSFQSALSRLLPPQANQLPYTTTI